MRLYIPTVLGGSSQLVRGLLTPVKVYMTYDVTCKIDYGNLLKEIFALKKYIQGCITSMYSGDVMKIE